MKKYIDIIKDLIKECFDAFAEAEPINDLEDYRRVQKWVNKATKRYKKATILAVIESIIVLFVLGVSEPFLLFFAILFFPAAFLLGNWGYATMRLHIRAIATTVLNAGRAGYSIGETFKTTHIEVRHEYANNYSISAYTEDKGCLFGLIAAGIRFVGWAAFCVYFGTFAVFKKLKTSIQNLNNFNTQ